MKSLGWFLLAVVLVPAAAFGQSREEFRARMRYREALEVEKKADAAKPSDYPAFLAGDAFEGMVTAALLDPKYLDDMLRAGRKYLALTGEPSVYLGEYLLPKVGPDLKKYPVFREMAAEFAQAYIATLKAKGFEPSRPFKQGPGRAHCAVSMASENIARLLALADKPEAKVWAKYAADINMGKVLGCTAEGKDYAPLPEKALELYKQAGDQAGVERASKAIEAIHRKWQLN